MFYSTKTFRGYSTCFRQHLAKESHCRFLHGYSLEFKVTFVGELDEKNWVCDFGCFKRNGIKDALSSLFDHTTIVAYDDPKISYFKQLDNQGIIQLRIIPNVGSEKFAEYVFYLISQKILESEKGRVFVKSVECFENIKNSAIYADNYIEEKIENNDLDYAKETILEKCRILGLPPTSTRGETPIHTCNMLVQ